MQKIDKKRCVLNTIGLFIFGMSVSGGGEEALLYTIGAGFGVLLYMLSYID